MRVKGEIKSQPSLSSSPKGSSDPPVGDAVGIAVVMAAACLFFFLLMPPSVVAAAALPEAQVIT